MWDLGTREKPNISRLFIKIGNLDELSRALGALNRGLFHSLTARFDPAMQERLLFQVVCDHMVRKPAPLPIVIPDRFLALFALNGRHGPTDPAFDYEAEPTAETANVPKVLEVAI